MREVHEWSLEELRRAIDAGEISPDDVVAKHRERAEALGPELNAFTELTTEGVRDRGPLRGLPVAVKDSFVDGGRAPKMGSNVHATWMSGTADVLVRLREAGATVLGYTNLHEWAIATTSTVTATGPIHNPWDLDRIAGGSSGGSAAAVAGGLAPVAIGTDAGGSVRIPAACCGVVGLKPTFGAIPLAGEPVASSPVNTLGVIARNVRDAAYLFGILAGRPDESVDATSLTLGVPGNFFFDDVDPKVRAIVESSIELLGSSFSDVRAVEVAGVEKAKDAISASVLAHVAGLLREDIDARPEAFDPWTLRMLQHGIDLAKEPPPDFDAARRAWTGAFEACDVIAVPTLPAPTPRIDQRKVELPSGPKSADLAQIELNAPMNVAGVPALAVPCGELDDMPVSLTLVARHDAEAVLFAAGERLEDALDRAYRGRVAVSARRGV